MTAIFWTSTNTTLFQARGLKCCLHTFHLCPSRISRSNKFMLYLLSIRCSDIQLCLTEYGNLLSICYLNTVLRIFFLYLGICIMKHESLYFRCKHELRRKSSRTYWHLQWSPSKLYTTELSTILCSLLAIRPLKINPPRSDIATSNLAVPRKNSISDCMLVEHVVQVHIHPQEHACTYTQIFVFMISPLS